MTQKELEDVLSLDDEVLDEIYQHHLPPNLSMVRIPALVWSRLRHELQEYMVDRQADGKIVSVLYHRYVQYLMLYLMLYQCHMPQNLSAVRIPALVWSRLRHELQQYMVVRPMESLCQCYITGMCALSVFTCRAFRSCKNDKNENLLTAI